MKLGVLTVALQSMRSSEAFRYLAGLGVETVELGAGGYPGSHHLLAEKIAGDQGKIADFKSLVHDSGLGISALACHGNPIHPDRDRAKHDHEIFVRTCALARDLGVDTVVTFSGCPGDCPNSVFPNWVTCAWPDDYSRLLEWQWNEVLIPYWRETAALAADFGIRKIALEMHPGFMVYNPKTLLRLRAAVGEAIGANLDPSHLIWQGIDIGAAIRALKGTIYNFHAKDTYIDPFTTAVNGVLDTECLSKESERSWYFRTIGFGHGEEFWREVVSALRLADFDGSLTIEHEDSLLSPKEGLEKAIAFMKNVIIKEKRGAAYWV